MHWHCNLNFSKLLLMAKKTTSKPWDRPVGTRAPNRFGDRKPDGIYYELGRALSIWELVQATMQILFDAFDPTGEFPELRLRFQISRNVHERAAIVEGLAERQRDKIPTKSKIEFKLLIEKGLRQNLALYRGWAERRNDLAHGCVTPAYSPDYSKKSLPMVVNYSLCPSPARDLLWPNVEPQFNYVASEIKAIADEFDVLANKIKVLAQEFKGIVVPL